MKPSYSSYSEINKQLEILKVERQISFHKVMRSTNSITDNLAPSNLFKLGIGTIGSSIGNSKGLKAIVVSTILKFLVNKFIKRRS